MSFHDFIKSDIETIRQNANFTKEQSEVFEELIKPEYGVTQSDVAVYVKLNISESKFYKIKKEIKQKVGRILKQ